MNARSATINPVLNGFIVQIGCQTLVFDSPAALGAAVIEYYLDPARVEKRYLASAVNKPELAPTDPPADTCNEAPRALRRNVEQAIAGQCGGEALRPPTIERQ